MSTRMFSDARGGLVAHRQRHLAPNAGIRVAGEPRCHRHDVEARAPHGTVGRDAQRRIVLRLGRARALATFRTQLIQQVNRTAAHVRAGIVEQRGDRVHRRRAARLQSFESDRANVDSGRAQRGDLPVDGCGVKGRGLRIQIPSGRSGKSRRTSSGPDPGVRRPSRRSSR